MYKGLQINRVQVNRGTHNVTGSAHNTHTIQCLIQCIITFKPVLIIETGHMHVHVAPNQT